MAGNQFSPLRTRRFLPFFMVQALGALGDNLFRQALVALTALQVAGAIDGLGTGPGAALIAGAFVLPFLLFSHVGGEWAERYDVALLTRRLKLVGVAIAAFAALGFWTGSVPLLLGTLFLAGIQAALFGPLKYAILPQVLRPEALLGGNALVVSSTLFAVLVGTLAGEWFVSETAYGAAEVSIILLLIAIAAWASACAMPAMPTAPAGEAPQRSAITGMVHTFIWLRGQRAVLNAVLGISWFWFFGMVLVQQLPQYMRVNVGGDETLAAFMLLLLAVGIGASALLCWLLSRRTVEIGLVPLGALGLTVFGLDLCLAAPQPVAAELSLLAFFDSPGMFRLCVDIVLTGVSGGLFVLPLHALIQQRSPRPWLSRVIAINNMLSALFMLQGSVLTIVLLRAGMDASQLLLAMVLLNVVVAIYIFTLVPEFVARFASWLVIKVLYRVEVRNLAHMPAEGPALVVCNHVSYMDALLLMGSLPRPVRFVMYYRIFGIPGLNLVFRAARAIPIAGSKEDPQVMERAFEDVDAALANGEVVGIFPEGRLTTDGEIASFRAGVERILARRPVPVMPIALRGMWRSMWSRRDSRLGRMRLPRRFRARVMLVAGPSMPGAEATATILEQRVRALRGDNA